MKPFHCLVFLAWCAAIGAARGEVFKCSVQGRVVYQSDPCGSVAKGARLEVSVRPIVSEDAHAVEQVRQQIERDIALANQMERERLAGELDREILLAEQRISELRQRMDMEMEALRAEKAKGKSKSRSKSRDAAREKSISEEMVALTTRFKTDIQVEQDELAQLRLRRKAL